jgi:hypothetical protein
LAEIFGEVIMLRALITAGLLLIALPGELLAQVPGVGMQGSNAGLRMGQR